MLSSSRTQMKAIVLCLAILTLIASFAPFLMGSGGSCKVNCDDGDVCLGSVKGGESPVCMRSLQVCLIVYFGDLLFQKRVDELEGQVQVCWNYLQLVDSSDADGSRSQPLKATDL